MIPSIVQRYAKTGERIDSVLVKPAHAVSLGREGLLDVLTSVRGAVEAMHAMRGVGIAWPQIGIPLRAFVSCPSGKRGDERVFVNPDYFHPRGYGKDFKSHEGCLSVHSGTHHVEVWRFSDITFHAHEVLDWWKPVSGRPGRGARFAEVKFHAIGMEALVLQHETDHLDGILLGGVPEAGDRGGGSAKEV